MAFMKRRTVILYWMIILIPTLLISLYLFRMLSHEKERLENESLITLKNRAVQLSDTIKITMDTVEDELGNALTSIDQRKLEDVLKSFESNNPLVRNVFIYSTEKGLVYPEEGLASTREEKLFSKRYDAFFSGRVKFESTIERVSDESDRKDLDIPVDSIGSVKKNENYFVPRSKNAPEKEKGRKKLVSFARQKNPAAIEKRDEKDAKKTEWLTWFSGNRLYILGWVKSGSNLIYGIELEIITILSQIAMEFPRNESKGIAYALIDGAGNVLHKTGSLNITKKSKPDFTVDLLPNLPHWKIAVFMDNNMKASGRYDMFVILTGILLTIFIIAIITGGGLLTHLAYRNMKDAAQKTSFVSNVSHELKTPLTSIRMYAELLGEGRVKDEAKKKRYLEVIIEESRRLTRLVNNVLNFSRLERGLKKYNITSVDMNEELKEVAESISFTLKKSGMELQFSDSEKEIVINTDRDAVKQVILNLIDNASKYGSDGKIVEISLCEEGEYIRIDVRDYGPGIPESHKVKIFEKFHRVDNSLTSKKQGAGLGLSIARGIVEDLGGSIEYQPGEKKGSIFTILLPVRGEMEDGEY